MSSDYMRDTFFQTISTGDRIRAYLRDLGCEMVTLGDLACDTSITPHTVLEVFASCGIPQTEAYAVRLLRRMLK